MKPSSELVFFHGLSQHLGCFTSQLPLIDMFGEQRLFLITLSNPHLMSESAAVSQEVMEKEEDNFDAACVFDSIYICILLIRG